MPVAEPPEVPNRGPALQGAKAGEAGGSDRVGVAPGSPPGLQSRVEAPRSWGGGPWWWSAGDLKSSMSLLEPA